MIALALALLLIFTPASATGEEGTISGVVRNRSADGVPVAGAAVVLRVQFDGQQAVLAETTTDHAGRFSFEHLPIGDRYRYLPGATRDGVHYPLSAVQLTPQRPQAKVEILVCDALADPSPLILRSHQIEISPEPGVLRVVESMAIENPSTKSYVGKANAPNAEPVTLQLNIPTDFERITFDEEFYGRRFLVADGRLVTAIPWTPGVRRLKFTYVIRNAHRQRLWLRPMDLPCEQLQVTVHSDRPDEIRCNVPSAGGQDKARIFRSVGPIPGGHVLHLELGRLPLAWIDYLRWSSPLVLVGLIAAAAEVLRRGASTRPA